MECTPGRYASQRKEKFPVACNKCNKCNCSHHCSGCSHSHAQVNYGNCSTGCGCSNPCSSCSGCNTSYNYGYGALRSISAPFSNCSNWGCGNSGYNYPFYTGPCGPCEPCKNCCCPDWPWPPLPPHPCWNGGCVPVIAAESGCTGASAAGNTTEVVTTRTTTTDVKPLVPLSAYGSSRLGCSGSC